MIRQFDGVVGEIGCPLRRAARYNVDLPASLRVQMICHVQPDDSGRAKQNLNLVHRIDDQKNR